MIKCEHCNKDIPSYEDAHSMIIVLQKVHKTNGYSWFQCEEGGMVDGHNFQHWHCSHDTMRAGVSTCIAEHYAEPSLVAVPPSQVRLHKHVLNAGLICKVCEQPLIDEAFRFCLTVATPANYIPDSSGDTLGEWCCSLDHARQNALNTVNAIKE